MWHKKKNQAATLSAFYYQMLVQQARQEWFYKELEITDTPLGRFEVLTIHLFMLLRRLKKENIPFATEISQLVSELFVVDLNESLRHLQISETKVAKQFNKLIQGFYGRVIAYDKAYEEGNGTLKEVINRNIYAENPDTEKCAEKIFIYIVDQIENLQLQDLTQLKFKRGLK